MAKKEKNDSLYMTRLPATPRISGCYLSLLSQRDSCGAEEGTALKRARYDNSPGIRSTLLFVYILRQWRWFHPSF